MEHQNYELNRRQLKMTHTGSHLLTFEDKNKIEFHLMRLHTYVDHWTLLDKGFLIVERTGEDWVVFRTSDGDIYCRL